MPVPPKPASKRRNRGTPKSWGAATPVKAGRAARQPDDLGFTAHPLIQSLWEALADSVEARFYSAADWERVRIELFYGNRLTRARSRPPAASWAAFHAGLTALLVSPAEKRRVGVELKPSDPDTDEIAAVSMMSKYQRSLKPV